MHWPMSFGCSDPTAFGAKGTAAIERKVPSKGWAETAEIASYGVTWMGHHMGDYRHRVLPKGRAEVNSNEWWGNHHMGQRPCPIPPERKNRIRPTSTVVLCEKRGRGV